MRTKLPSCIENPATGKPYTRHRYDMRTTVTSYTGSFSGGMRPATYQNTHRCVRCGFTQVTTY